MVKWEDVEPLTWQHRTNIKEHKQIFDKMNEIIDNINTGTTAPVDPVPTKNSPHLVKSGGVYEAIENWSPKMEIDVYPTVNSDHLVKSGGVYNADYLIETKTDRAEATANRAEKAINDADDAPTKGSQNLIKSGAVYVSEEILKDADKQILGIANRAETTANKAGKAANDAATKATQAETAANVARSTADEVKKAIDQADNKPTKDSQKLVKSGGVYEAIESCSPKLEIDDEPTENSQKLVKSGGVYKADAKIYKYAWDAYYAVSGADKEPVKDSQNLILSGGVYSATEGFGDMKEKVNNHATLLDKIVNYDLPETIQTAVNAASDAKEALKNSKFEDITEFVRISSPSEYVRGKVFIVNNRLLIFDMTIDVRNNRQVLSLEALQSLLNNSPISAYNQSTDELETFDISGPFILNRNHSGEISFNFTRMLNYSPEPET